MKKISAFVSLGLWLMIGFTPINLWAEVPVSRGSFRDGTLLSLTSVKPTYAQDEDVILTLNASRTTAQNDPTSNFLSEWNVVVLDEDPNIPGGGVELNANGTLVSPTAQPIYGNGTRALGFVQFPALSLSPGIHTVEGRVYTKNSAKSTRVECFIVIEG